jgi:hypothetical protein
MPKQFDGRERPAPKPIQLKDFLGKIKNQCATEI